MSFTEIHPSTKLPRELSEVWKMTCLSRAPSKKQEDATGGGSEKQKLDKLIKSSLKIKLLRRQNDKMIYIFPARREYVFKTTHKLKSIS